MKDLLVFAAVLSMALPVLGQVSKRSWDHEPAKWSDTADSLALTVPAGTDYWRLPGITHDNGPLQYVVQSGDFEAKVRVSGKYHELYHQAGLMIRLDDKNWIKTGIEFVDGHQNVSAVVTRDISDWSVVPRPDNPAFIWIRLQRRKDSVQIDYSFNNSKWQMLRVAYFPPDVPVKIGMAAAAPGKEDFPVTFDHFSVEPLPSH